MPSPPDRDESRPADGRIDPPIDVCRPLALATVLVLAVQPALAQSDPTAFCDTAMADTIRNIFTLIQLGGPLIGGTIALGAIAILPSTRRSDRKEQLKEMRNQGVVWGVLVAPLGTFILQFLLNNVVVGGSGCGF